MSNLVDRLGATLLDASLASIAITGLVVLVMVQCRQPARRLGWARAGLLSTLALLPLSALNPVPRIELWGPLRQLDPARLGDPRSDLDRRKIRGEGPDFADRTRPLEPSQQACQPSPPRWLRWLARGFVLAYGIGVSISLGWHFLGLWGSAWVVARGRTTSTATIERYRALPFAGRTARPRLLISDRVSRPVLVGFFRPVILIPPGLVQPEATESLRLSLLHELAHAEQSDHQFGPSAALAQAIWFFLPPVWWIRDQMKLDQEFLADRGAVAHFGTSGSYTWSLVDLASTMATESDPERSGTTRAEASADSQPGVASALMQRVQMLLKCPFAIEGRSPLWWRWSTALTLALVTMAASCLTLRGAAGWFDPNPVPLAEITRSFRLPQLVVSQLDNDDQPFDLRFRLPDQFSLTFEVMAEPSELANIEILGHRLGPSTHHEVDPTRTVYRLWHRVELRRANGTETVKVNDQLQTTEPKLTKLNLWLTIRAAPGQTVRLRDLDLLW